MLCGTRYFSSRGRIEPVRGFTEAEAGLRNACLNELTDFRTAALPEDASRNDVNRAVRTLQAQYRRQFRTAYETSAAAEVKRRRTQEATIPPTTEEPSEEQAADGSAADAPSAPAAIPPAVQPAPRVAQLRTIPLPPPRPRDLAPAPTQATKPEPSAQGAAERPSSAETGQPKAATSMSEVPRPADRAEETQSRASAAPEPVPTVAPPAATPLLVAPAAPAFAAALEPTQPGTVLPADPPAAVMGPGPSQEHAKAATEPATTREEPQAASIPPAAVAVPAVRAPVPPSPSESGGGHKPAIDIAIPPASQTPPAPPVVASLPPSPGADSEGVSQIARRSPSPERVRLLDSAIGQHRVCLARAVLSVGASAPAQDVLSSVLRACAEQQEARIAREIDVAGPVAVEASQRVRASIAEATRAEAVELIGLLRGTKN